MSAGPSPFPIPELTATPVFPGRDPRHPERRGRGWGRETKYDASGAFISTETWGGYIQYDRADKYALDRRVSPLCKSLIEHFAAETVSAPGNPAWAYSSIEELELMTGRKRRAIEMAIEEGARAAKTAVLPGVIEREFPERRYDKGGFRVNLWRIPDIPLRPERTRAISASLRAPRAEAALRGSKAQATVESLEFADAPEERARQIAILERRIAEVRRQDAAGRANNCPPEPVQPAAETGLPHDSAQASGAQPDAAQTGAQPDADTGAAQPDAALTQISAKRASSNDAPGAVQCPQCGAYLIVLSSNHQASTSSSSGGNATGKVTTTTDDPNPRTTPERERPDSTATPATETDAERALVAEAILQQRIPADDLLVGTIIHACRANERTATTDEIRHFIDVKGPIAWSKEHPGAYLRTAVSNCFAGASFAEFRKAAASLLRTGPRMPSPAEVEAQRNLTEAQEAEQQAWEAQRQRLKEHPEECMKCSGKGHYQLEERRKLCDCPAGDQRRCRGERDSP